MSAKVICLVTIHGVGFQQPPEDGNPGYADDLHQNLSRYLGPDLLGDDPQRQRSQAGEAGPVYVESAWPPGSCNIEQGLKRLGTWTDEAKSELDIAGAALVNHGQRIAHVALVYSRLADQEPHLGALLETASSAAIALGHYATATGMARMALQDAWALLQRPGEPEAPVTPSLRVRTDPGFRPPDQPLKGSPSGLLATLRQLEDDVAAYVCRNDMRTRVRAFLWEALLRLSCREDVEALVVNAHSNGTVVSFDVLRGLPLAMAQQTKAFVTAGAALRKYVELFFWGNEGGSVQAIPRWLNFWDLADPVGDPLRPPLGWKRGDSPPPDAPTSLFEYLDPTAGTTTPIAIDDIAVDNVRNSRGGGLRAHNYWDNDEQFVKPLAELLRGLATSPPALPTSETRPKARSGEGS